MKSTLNQRSVDPNPHPLPLWGSKRLLLKGGDRQTKKLTQYLILFTNNISQGEYRMITNKRLFLLSIVLMAMILFMPTVNAKDPVTVEYVGHIGGVTYDVDVVGNYAYIGEGPRLTILDISNPKTPTVVGKTEFLPSIVQGIAVDGNYAYIANGGGGLRVIDISTPSSPTEVGFVDIGDARPGA